MRHAGTFLPLAALLTLAACAEAPSAPPPATTAGTPTASPPRAPARPVTRFDGHYAGTLALTPDRTRACPPAPAEAREITVQDGRATFKLNPQFQQTQTGTVGPEGSVRMTGMIDRNIATSGLFTDTGFLGEYRNGLCAYAVQMTKRG